MKRTKMLNSLGERERPWDMIVIGGGATGLGVAVDAASRGYQTLLLEMKDFAHGTSSRSTKLVHGGVRYLEQGNVKLVWEALTERGRLFQNAPHLVNRQPFVVPFYQWWKGLYYWTGLKAYDLLAGKRNIGFSQWLSSAKTKGELPGLNPEGLSGGILYYDGQFDDARLAISLALTSADNGGVLINYMKVTGLLKSGDTIQGVQARDLLNDREYSIQGRAVINATGAFTDKILEMDQPGSEPVIQPSQGIHIVVDKDFLGSDTAMMIPETVDGRVLFAIPWHDKVMIGTTDTPVEEVFNEPKAMEEEIQYILDHVSQYLEKKPDKEDIRSVFAGLRPLVNRNSSDNTAEISRDHSLFESPSGLITIAGGKWTTYRRMAEEVVDRAISSAGLESRECVTDKLKIHGAGHFAGGQSHVTNTQETLISGEKKASRRRNTEDPIENENTLNFYGSDRYNIQDLVNAHPKHGKRLHPRLPYIRAEVIWATRNEMAMTVEDILARRTRALFIDAKVSAQIAPKVARLMAAEAGYDERWVQEQIASYKELVSLYLPSL